MDLNSGLGWGMMYIFNGDIYNYNLGEFGNGGSKFGGNGGNSGNYSGSFGGGQFLVIVMVFGLFVLVILGVEGLVLFVFGDVLLVVVVDVLVVLKGLFKFGLWGIVIYGVLFFEIVKDDLKMMLKIVMLLLVDMVMEMLVSFLLLDQVMVSVIKCVVDIVKDEWQYIVVVIGWLMSVFVVDVKLIKCLGVFSVLILGFLFLQVSVFKGVLVVKVLLKGIIVEKGDLCLVGFMVGGNFCEVVICFLKESGQKLVYVLVMDVFILVQVKQCLEEEKCCQQVWDVVYLEEGLKREYDKVKVELDVEDKNIVILNSCIVLIEKVIFGVRVVVQEVDKKVKEVEVNKDDFVIYNLFYEYGFGWQDQVCYFDKDIQNQNEKLKVVQIFLNEMNEFLFRDKVVFFGVMESWK